MPRQLRPKETIVTYHSENTPFDNWAWVAYINLGPDYLGIRFNGATEEDAYNSAYKFWQEGEAARRKARKLREAEKAEKLAKSNARKAS